jgi:hypothetical protein
MCLGVPKIGRASRPFVSDEIDGKLSGDHPFPVHVLLKTPGPIYVPQGILKNITASRQEVIKVM